MYAEEKPHHEIEIIFRNLTVDTLFVRTLLSVNLGLLIKAKRFIKTACICLLPFTVSERRRKKGLVPIKLLRVRVYCFRYLNVFEKHLFRITSIFHTIELWFPGFVDKDWPMRKTFCNKKELFLEIGISF